MTIDEATGEVLEPDDDEEEDNVLPLRPPPPPRPPRPGARRATISGSSSTAADDARTLTAHSRMVEVEGNLERLGNAALRETLENSEGARRLLTQDLIEAKDRLEDEVSRIRDGYDRAAQAAESRHSGEARRWREERDRLRTECDRLERELKESRKAKKKHKRSVAELELKLAELHESGSTTRSILGLLAPGVQPIASKLATGIPDLFSFLRSVTGSVYGADEPAAEESDESVMDRAAAIRFVASMYAPDNEELFAEIRHLAIVIENGPDGPQLVSEWSRVERYIQRAIRREAAQASAKREERHADASQEEGE